MKKWTYDATRTKADVALNLDVWEALGRWHAERGNKAECLPVNIPFSHGDSVRTIALEGIAGSKESWHALWKGLKRYGHQPGASPSSAQPSPPSGSVAPPRASDLNKLRYAGFGAADAEAEKASELVQASAMWQAIQQPPDKEALFWIALPHFEGELRVGLGHISFSNPKGIQWVDTPATWRTELTAQWYTRVTDNKHSWGGQPHFIKSFCKVQGKHVRDTSGCSFADLIPITATFTETSTFDKPFPTKRSIAALKAYCERTGMWQQARADSESTVSQHQWPTRSSEVMPDEELLLLLSDADDPDEDEVEYDAERASTASSSFSVCSDGDVDADAQSDSDNAVAAPSTAARPTAAPHSKRLRRVSRAPDNFQAAPSGCGRRL